MSGIAVAAPVLTWAQRRSGRADDEIRKKFSDWDKWLSFEKKPSFAQVEKVADFTRVPLGYFFLPVPRSRNCQFLISELGALLQLRLARIFSRRYTLISEGKLGMRIIWLISVSLSASHLLEVRQTLA